MTPLIINKTANLFGLQAGDLENIIAVIQQQNEVQEAIIFGSRAKGNYKNGSDIDIALKGSDVNHNTSSNISYVLNEETQMPYRFDVLNYETISNKDLIEHIDRVGICFYKRAT
jgi:predicted nucleotidyltransferase